MTSLRQRMTEDMQVRNLAWSTADLADVLQVSLFARHFSKPPVGVGAGGDPRLPGLPRQRIKACPRLYLSSPSPKLSGSSTRFHSRGSGLSMRSFRRRRSHKKLPVVLSPEEVLEFLSCVGNTKHRTILTTCYAAGLRISEAVRLKPTDIDSKRMKIASNRARAKRIDTRCSPLGYWRPCAHIGEQGGRRHGCLREMCPASRSTEAPSNKLAKRHGAFPASVSRSRPIPCATHSPFTCWNQAQMFALSSYCSAIAVLQLPPGICGSPPVKYARHPVPLICCLTQSALIPNPPRPSTSKLRGHGWSEAGSGGHLPPLRPSLSRDARRVDVYSAATCHDRH